MKLSAQLASASAETSVGDGAGKRDAVKSEGGACYVARKLSEFCADNEGKVEVHAVGHSAGSIFHCYFIPAALDLGAPHFKSVHFLAPAVRVDTFKIELADRIGNGVDQLSIFTMSKSFEQDDNCASVYRKSLLYLIYHALEPERKTPILGLEVSLRDDPELKNLLGLGVPNASGEVIWSVSLSDKGRNASTSTTHGGFDDDGPTLNSVAQRMLGKADADNIIEYVTGERGMRGADLWKDQVDWPEQLKSEFRYTPATGAPVPAQPVTTPAYAPAVGVSLPPSAAVMAGGRRRAICVGINRYPTAPLSGCVADAQAWAGALKRLGFEDPVMLLDERATRASIVESLTSLVTSSRPGGVIAFQYSGHGTQLPDLNGDEIGGDSPGQDEALCPYDFASGAFLIDDDVGETFNRLPGGVNLTCFMDCCHSGTISRFAVGSTPGATVGRAEEHPRFINATDQLKQAHRRFRESIGGHRAISSGGPSLMKEIVFSACLSSEVAWESGGQGEFTVRALRVLQGGVDGITNEQFEVDNNDGAQQVRYRRVDLDDKAVLMKDGQDPTPSDPRFHQQMVYAVCSNVYSTFRSALGRQIAWGFKRREEPERLYIRPHAFSGQNAYYDEKLGELNFGYYRATEDLATDRTLPGGFVFTCLSHDVIAHELTHAILDGLRSNFSLPSGADVIAFHEAFADLVALFQHFSYKEVVRTAIATSGGKIEKATFLTDLAQQFGHTIGKKAALRSAIDTEPPKLYDQKLEHHELGGILVSAVFEAFLTVYKRKTARYIRLATSGSGMLPAGELPTDLQSVLADKASRLAGQFLCILIRAIDYCPPIDLRFGEYLRAIITADYDLVPDDVWGYREALIDAFLRRNIYPRGVSSLSEDALLWRPTARPCDRSQRWISPTCNFRAIPLLPPGRGSCDARRAFWATSCHVQSRWRNSASWPTPIRGWKASSSILLRSNRSARQDA